MWELDRKSDTWKMWGRWRETEWDGDREEVGKVVVTWKIFVR